MFIQFTKDMGLSFYTLNEERVAVRSTSPKNRYLHQEGETKPLLSMVTHPHRRRRRRMTDGCNDVGALSTDCSNRYNHPSCVCTSRYSAVRCYYQEPQDWYFEDDIPVEYSDEARACYNPMKRCSREV